MAAHDFDPDMLAEYTAIAPTGGSVRQDIKDCANAWRNSAYDVMVTTVGLVETDAPFVHLEETMLKLAEQMSKESVDWTS